MNTITLTAAESGLYERGDDIEALQVMRSATSRARALCEESGEPVKVETAAGDLITIIKLW